MFQHAAARRRLEVISDFDILETRFNTQPPEGGWSVFVRPDQIGTVSTRSRPKAAGRLICYDFGL